jgi:hypothetical protein
LLPRLVLDIREAVEILLGSLERRVLGIERQLERIELGRIGGAGLNSIPDFGVTNNPSMSRAA